MQMVYMIVGGIFFLWFAIPYLAKGILNIGNLTGMILFALVCLYGFFHKKLHLWMLQIREHKVGAISVGILFFVAMLIVATVAIETFLMVHATGNEPASNTTAVVLGCSVKGTKPSRILQERLDAAYEYLLENEEANCVLSGGQGAGEDITEAECMYRYLTEKGIDGERLIKEEHSTDTEENLRYTKEILDTKGWGNAVTIITSEFHAYRACALADKIGLESYSTPSHTYLLYLPTYYVRELYGILYYVISK